MPLETEIERLTTVIRDNTVVMERLLSALADDIVTPAKAETRPIPQTPPRDPTPEPVPDEAVPEEAAEPKPEPEPAKSAKPKRKGKPKAKPNGDTPADDPTITRDMVRSVVSAYNKEAGREAAIALMKEHGDAEALRNVDKSHYPALYAAGREALDALGKGQEAA
jgi:outer membrane biosynthesis protein TonB